MKLVSAKGIILKIVRDLGIGDQAIPWQDFVEWIGEGLQHIGAYGQLVESTSTIAIDNFKGKLPEDYYSARPNPNLSFKITGDTIQVGFQQGCVDLQYLAFPLDEEGFPLVPDNVSYATALFWKVAMQLAIRDELPNKKLDYATCKSRWDWYCQQAGAQGQKKDAQFAQRFVDLFTSRIPVLTNYNQDFTTVNGSVEPPFSAERVNYIPQQFIPKPGI